MNKNRGSERRRLRTAGNALEKNLEKKPAYDKNKQGQIPVEGKPCFGCPTVANNLLETFAAVKVTKHANTLHNALAHPSVHFSLSFSKPNAYVSLLLLSTAPAKGAYLKQGILIQDTLAQATLCSCCKELLRKGNPFPCCNGFCLEAKRGSNCLVLTKCSTEL